MEAVACERILALEELDPAHCRHDDDGAAHAAVGAGAAADRIEAVAERRLETHRAAMALAGPNVRVAHHYAKSPVQTLLFGSLLRYSAQDHQALFRPPQAARSHGRGRAA